VTDYAETSTSNELCATVDKKPDTAEISRRSLLHGIGCIQIAEGSIAPGENDTDCSEAVTVETGGGNDLLDKEEHDITRSGENLHRGFFFFCCLCLQTNLATRPPGECNEAAPYADYAS